MMVRISDVERQAVVPGAPSPHRCTLLGQGHREVPPFEESSTFLSDQAQAIVHQMERIAYCVR